MIPKIFHRIWIGTTPIPAEFAGYGATWLQHHPGWELREYSEAALTTRYPDLVSKCREFRYAANIYRYELLLQHGGVYIDMDFECRKNIEELLLDSDFVAAAQRGDMRAPDALNNAFIACTPGNAVMQRIVDAIPRAYEEGMKRPGWFGRSHFGPSLFTKIVLKSGAKILPSKLFYPYSSDELHLRNDPFPDAYAVHHWDACTRFRGRGIITQ